MSEAALEKAREERLSVRETRRERVSPEAVLDVLENPSPYWIRGGASQ